MRPLSPNPHTTVVEPTRSSWWSTVRSRRRPAPALRSRPVHTSASTTATIWRSPNSLRPTPVKNPTMSSTATSERGASVMARVADARHGRLHSEIDTSQPSPINERPRPTAISRRAPTDRVRVALADGHDLHRWTELEGPVRRVRELHGRVSHVLLHDLNDIGDLTGTRSSGTVTGSRASRSSSAVSATTPFARRWPRGTGSG